jgi:hypothetical protein
MRNTRRKWLPLTYEPKIQGVIEGSIRQTIRPGRKYQVDDEIAFHGWQGKPYRSKWSFRSQFWKLKSVYPCRIFPGGIQFFVMSWGSTNLLPWNTVEMDYWARNDGIDPPTGIELAVVLLSMYRIPKEGMEAQILRW